MHFSNIFEILTLYDQAQQKDGWTKFQAPWTPGAWKIYSRGPPKKKYFPRARQKLFKFFKNDANLR